MTPNKVVSIVFALAAMTFFIDLAFEKPTIEQAYISSLGNGKWGKSGLYCRIGLTDKTGESFIEIDVVACQGFKGGERVYLQRSLLFSRPSIAYTGGAKINLAWNTQGFLVLLLCISSIILSAAANAGLALTRTYKEMYPWRQRDPRD